MLYTVNKREVRILLECILVFFYLCSCSMKILNWILYEPICKRCGFRFRSNTNEHLLYFFCELCKLIQWRDSDTYSFFQVGRTDCYCSNVLVPTRRGISECMYVCLGDDKGICGYTNKAAFYDTSKADLSECVPRKNLFLENGVTQLRSVYTQRQSCDNADALDQLLFCKS